MICGETAALKCVSYSRSDGTDSHTQTHHTHTPSLRPWERWMGFAALTGGLERLHSLLWRKVCLVSLVRWACQSLVENNSRYCSAEKQTDRSNPSRERNLFRWSLTSDFKDHSLLQPSVSLHDFMWLSLALNMVVMVSSNYWGGKEGLTPPK